METICKLEEKYGIIDEEFLNHLKNVDKFQVVTPVVGQFSAGKSSLINALLGKKYLGVNLSPETSVPTEICYGAANNVTLFNKKNEVTEISLTEFCEKTFNVDET